MTFLSLTEAVTKGVSQDTNYKPIHLVGEEKVAHKADSDDDRHSSRSVLEWCKCRHLFLLVYKQDERWAHNYINLYFPTGPIDDKLSTQT